MTADNRIHSLGQQASWVVLLIFFFASRVFALTALPLHNDEGLHLTRAVEVWNLHPFWDISDGKIINHWPIAALYPQYAPDFVARIATVLVVLPGAAAGYALVRHLAGRNGAVLAVIFWAFSPYLFFYERLAQSDAEAAAWVVVATWAALLAAERGRYFYAFVAGGALAFAALLKFTAAPYALVVAGIVVLLGRGGWGKRLGQVAVMGLVGVLAFMPPLLYVALRGRSFFDVALGWVAGEGGASTLGDRAGLLLTTASDFGALGWLWVMVIVVGWLGWLARLRYREGVLFGLAVVPLAMILVLSNEVFPRHFIVTLPLLVGLAGAGWGVWLARITGRRWVTVALMALLAINALPFYSTAYRNPATLPLPAVVAREFQHDHSAGFGLREATTTIATDLPADAPVIASMFPASCRRANFYLPVERAMQCGDAPSRERIETALMAQPTVYVLTDRHPMIGLLLEEMPGRVVETWMFPRPGETADTATVVLVELAAD